MTAEALLRVGIRDFRVRVNHRNLLRELIRFCGLPADMADTICVTIDKADKVGFDGVRAEMAEHGYFFQYMLYAAVLHHRLKTTLGQNYSWEKHFGGIRYFFLRGVAADGVAPVFADRPSEALLDDFADALGIGKEVRQ